MGLYNLPEENNYIYNSIVKNFLDDFYKIKVKDTEISHYYRKYKEFFINDINQLKEYLDISKYNLNLSKEEINNLKINLITDRIIYAVIENKGKNKENQKMNYHKISYWIYAPGGKSSKWDEFYEEGIMAIAWDKLGNLKGYENKSEINKKLQEYYPNNQRNPSNNALTCYNFAYTLKKGDIIISKKGRNEYVGYGIVIGEYEYHEKLKEYKHIRKIKWIKKGHWNADSKIVSKTLTNVDKYVEYIEELKILLNINENFILNNNIKTMHKENLLLNLKKQIILYGPPGTGKTFNTKYIIESHSGENYNELKKQGRVEFITFHQSFSYEEFIEGIKPDLENNAGKITYQIEDGIYKKICKKGKENYENTIKTKDELSKEGKRKRKLGDFLNSLLESENTLTRTKGGEFQVIDLGNNEIKIFSNRSKYNEGEIILKIDELLKIIQSNKEFKSSRELAKEIFGKENQRQKDSYYFSLFNEYKKINDKKIEKEEKIERKLKNFYLIIDEINRGNISKIFGELITLLETDKRLGEKNEIITKLPYSQEEFGIPPNLYIIATMNTSDRSIIALDTALRRRFGFIEMLPNYNLGDIDKDIEGINLSTLLKKINQRIEILLDKDHLIGHSYFLNITTKQELKQVFYYEIIPLLEEYFYGENEKIEIILGESFFEKRNIDKDIFESSSDMESNYNESKILILEKNINIIKALQNIIFKEINENSEGN